LLSPSLRAAEVVGAPAAPGQRAPGGGAAAEGEAGRAATSGWEASIDLGFVRDGDATVLVRHGQRGPLAVQRPFFPEGPAVCHVYLLHPPGGLVGGDRLRVDLRVADGAHALCTTPAATKIYRSDGAVARQEQRLSLDGDAVLEWLPQEIILHDGAAAELRTRIDLPAAGSRARFIGVELLCFGLPARGEGFGRGRCRQRLELWRGERPVAIERGRYDGASPVHAARWGLHGAPVLGTLLAAPAPAEVQTAAQAGATLQALRALADALPAGELGSVTVLGEGAALACRYLGASAERGRRFLHAAWRLLRPALLGRPATPPRIWAT
jgi:urease accessory protein